jgi:hypothetical protein
MFSRWAKLRCDLRLGVNHLCDLPSAQSVLIELQLFNGIGDWKCLLCCSYSGLGDGFILNNIMFGDLRHIPMLAFLDASYFRKR